MIELGVWDGPGPTSSLTAQHPSGSLMSDPGDGWTVVGKDGKFWRPEEGSPADRSAPDTAWDAQGATSTAEGCLQHVAKLQNQLESSKFFSSLRAALSRSGATMTSTCIVPPPPLMMNTVTSPPERLNTQAY